MRQFRFSPALLETPAFTVGDVLILLGVSTILYVGVRLAFHVPAVIAGPDISLSPLALPWYAMLSVARMAAAYFLSMLFSLFYGYAAARNRTAQTVLMPVLDVLQSVPILSFLPVVLLSLSAVLPQAFAAEFAGAGWEAAAAMVRVFPPSENVACNGTVPTRSRMADPFVSLRLEEAKGGSL